MQGIPGTPGFVDREMAPLDPIGHLLRKATLQGWADITDRNRVRQNERTTASFKQYLQTRGSLCEKQLNEEEKLSDKEFRVTLCKDVHQTQ